ncbi:MAG TPA: hypothetical protein VMW69_05040 [Spirochaetia bacterium]|nr:hypothetical protein [Spirochaetia bacterium]
MATPLTKSERVFLAGCVKSVMLSDGVIEYQENVELDALIMRLEFGDFGDCLESFESSVKDEEDFWQMASTIERAEARNIIIESLREIILHGGVPSEAGEILLSRLKETWTS